MSKTGIRWCAFRFALCLHLAAQIAFANELSKDETYKTGTHMIDTGNVLGAKSLLEKLVADSPKIARYKTSLATCNIAIGDLLKALKLLNEALALDANDAKAHAQRGSVLITQRKYREALQDFQTLLRLQPENIDALLGRASANILLGNFAVAKKDLDSVQARTPANPGLQRSLIFYYSSQGMTKDCIRQCTEGLKYLPKDAAIYMVRGRNYSAEKRCKEALVDYHRAEALGFGDKPELFASIAGAYNYLGQDKDCRKYLDRALAISPNMVNVLTLRSSMDFRDGNFVRAQADSERVVKVAPKDLVALNLLSHCYARQGRNSDVVKTSSIAIQVDPRPEFLLSRADALKQLGRLDESIKDCSTVIAQNAKNEAAYATRAQCKYLEKKPREALIDAEKAVALSPDDGYAKALKLRCLQEIDPSRDYKNTASNNEKSPELLDKDILQNPTSADSLVRRGNYYFRSLESEQAIADYSAAIKISPELTGAYVHRGMAYRATRQYDKAFADFDHALKIDPTDAQAYFETARLLRLLKRPAEALKKYDELARQGANSQLNLERGALLLSMHRLQPALEDANKALSMNPKRDEYKLKGDVLMALGRYRQAVDVYSEALKHATSDGMLYRARKAGYDKLGEKELAAADQKLIHKFESEIYETAPFLRSP